MRKVSIVILLAVLGAGCATATPTQKGALAGSVLGAGLGAIIGHQSGDTGKGALIGAAAGGLGGALIGDVMAKQFCPTCGKDYLSNVSHCPVDGSALRMKGAPAQTQQQQTAIAVQPKFCSTCGRSYDANATYCSEDGTKLKSKQS